MREYLMTKSPEQLERELEELKEEFHNYIKIKEKEEKDKRRTARPEYAFRRDL